MQQHMQQFLRHRSALLFEGEVHAKHAGPADQCCRRISLSVKASNISLDDTQAFITLLHSVRRAIQTSLASFKDCGSSWLLLSKYGIIINSHELC